MSRQWLTHNRPWMKPARNLIQGDLKNIDKKLADPTIFRISCEAQQRLRDRRDLLRVVVGLLERYIHDDERKREDER